MASVALWISDPVSAARHAAYNSNAAGALSAAQIPEGVTHARRAPSGTWARFVGMVQDVWDAELFVLRDGQGRSALLDEVVSGGDACPDGTMNNHILGERLPVYLVAPPGLTEWAAALYEQNRSVLDLPSPSDNVRRPKRQRDEKAGERIDLETVAATNSSESDSQVDRAMKKQLCGQGPKSELGIPHPGMGLNTPHIDTEGVAPFPAVIAKLYENIPGNALKVHTLVEVIGVLHSGPFVQPPAVDGCCNAEDMFTAESTARNPVGIPRLHVVKMRVLDGSAALNPLLATVNIVDARADLRLNAMPSMRDVLVRYLASSLGDDMLAAEYVLMSLLGRPSLRSEAGGVMGRLTLNIIFPSDSDEDACTEFISALKAVVPALVRVPINVPSLNVVELYPRKDYDANRLCASPLQLPTGCVLIGDETDLDNGQLQDRGVKNVRALSSVATKAMLPVDFHYYESGLLFDANAIFVSKGCKSIIPLDVGVRVNPSESLKLHSWRSYEAELLKKMRMALSLLAENGTFDIPEPVSRVVEDSFVAARKNGSIPGNDGQEVLSRWLGVARTAARSFGEDSLSQDRWTYVLDLENRRQASCRQQVAM